LFVLLHATVAVDAALAVQIVKITFPVLHNIIVILSLIHSLFFQPPPVVADTGFKVGKTGIKWPP
jgi:hypothetical protein